VRIRRHLSYANVTATICLFFVLAGGAAYAVDKINSHEIANNSIRSVDLKNRKAVKAIDVKPNTLTGRQVSERTLNAQSFAPLVGASAGDCDPSSPALLRCASATIKLKERSRVAVVATGGEESVGGPASSHCELQIDGRSDGTGTAPGEDARDNSSGAATNGFARTLVSRDPVAAGRHRVALACNQLSGNVRVDAPTIFAMAVGSP
jgi:hypothetical protein